MDGQERMSAVVALAERLGVSVRHEPLGGDGGGICMLKGRPVLFIDTMADLATQCDRSLSDLSQMPEIDTMYLVPELREEIERIRRRG
jgi:hypothetical protein